jgi:hypothetical protein
MAEKVQTVNVIQRARGRITGILTVFVFSCRLRSMELQFTELTM